MQPFLPKHTRKDGPEAAIQTGLVKRLKGYDWMCEVMHGNLFQFGIPDLYIAHRRYGARWVEVKNPESFSFTKAQLDKFPAFHAAGVGIWILFADTDGEVQKLLKPANWFQIYANYINGIRKYDSRLF